MDWNAIPDWKLIDQGERILLRVNKLRKQVKVVKIHSDKQIDFFVHKQGRAIVGYQLQIKSPDIVKYNSGWFLCLFFHEPDPTGPVTPIYHDDNIRLIEIDNNYTFAIRWKQRK